MGDPKFDLSQNFVTVATSKDDEFPGANGPDQAPMPTEADRQWALSHIVEWKRRYIARFVEVGFPEEAGLADYEGGCPEHDYSQDPVTAADEALSYYDDDGGLA